MILSLKREKTIIVEFNMVCLIDNFHLITGLVSAVAYGALSLFGQVDLNDRVLQTGFGAVVLVQLGLIAWLIQKYISEQRSLYQILLEHAKVLERLVARIDALHDGQRDMMQRMKCYGCVEGEDKDG